MQGPGCSLGAGPGAAGLPRCAAAPGRTEPRSLPGAVRGPVLITLAAGESKGSAPCAFLWDRDGWKVISDPTATFPYGDVW